jgi:hypothetical protein
LVFLTVFWVSQGSADIFTWTDRHGVTHLSNVRPPPGANVFVETREATHPEVKASKKPDATSPNPPRNSHSSRDDLETHLQTAKLDIGQDVDPRQSSHMAPGPVAPRPLVDTQYLRVAGTYPLRYKYKHHSYGTKYYYSPHYYRFPPWTTRPRLYKYDKHRILPKSYLRPTYIKKPHRDLHWYKHYSGVKHFRGHHIGRFSKRTYPHIGHLKPQPTIGHHRGIHYRKGYMRR